MDPEKEINDLEVVTGNGAEDSVSVDDFIRQLEAREKDLHITAETTIIEIAESFEDLDPPVFLTAQQASSPAADEDSPKFAAAVNEVIALQGEVSALRDKIATMEDERSDLLLGAQRRSRDFDAFRARTERERAEMMQNQVIDLAGRLLPALDNLYRALDSAAHIPEEKSEAFSQFFAGMVMVEKQVFEVLADMGIEAVPAVGSPFDPHLHEAVATETTEHFPVNTITQELLRGYRVGDRVIRHSMVKVAVPPAAAPVEPDGPETN